MKKTIVTSKLLRTKLKGIRRTQFLSIFLFLFFAPLFIGSLALIADSPSDQNQNQFTDQQKKVDKAQKVAKLTELLKGK